MATQSDSPPNSTKDIPQNPATVSQPAGRESQDSKPEATRESSPTSVFVNSEPVREDQVQNAVKFLSHPRVRGSPVMYRRSFLERKGLTKEEIDEAFFRVPDPTPSVSTTQPVAANEDEKVKSSSTAQPLAASQNLQPLSAPPSSSVTKVGYLSRFHWTHAVLALGILAASGAGTAVLLKKTIIPWLKSWIRKVVMEEDGEKGSVKGRPSLAEGATVAAKAAAAAAADVARASQEIVASKAEEKRYLEELTDLVNYQVQEMKSMSSSLQKLEGRSLLPLASVEPSVAAHPMSYMDIMAMVQRGEKPSNVRDINDQPPNPNQPVPDPRVALRLKPLEVGKRHNSSSNLLQSRGSGDGLNYGYQDNLMNKDNSRPWWERKNVRVTEIETEEPQKFGSTAASAQVRPVQRSWVPPQPPPIAIPAAAAAIRQRKKPLIQKEKLTDDELMARSSEISDDLQRITRISESGGLTEVNGSCSGQQLSGTPITDGESVY